MLHKGAGVRKYAFRYLGPDTKVHVLRKGVDPVHSIHKVHIYSEPLRVREKRDVENTVIAFLQQEHAREYMSLLVPRLNGKGGAAGLAMYAIGLIDLQGHCDKMRMPLGVVIDGYCDIGDKSETLEIYYYKNREPSSPTIFLH